jgi:hypothetical protein
MSNYAFEGPKWTGGSITWSFAPAGGVFTGAIQNGYQDTVRQAFARWASVAGLSFAEVSDSGSVDIRVGWGKFGTGQVGSTDYSYFQSSNETFLPGVTVRLEDPSERALSGGTYAGTATTLYEVALHEIGHALGLDHSTDPNATMYPSLGPANVNLDASDIQGMQALYGAAAASINSQTVANVPHSSAATAPLPPAITLSGDKVAVYRFFDSGTGTQFLTADATERNSVISTRPDLVYEGLGIAGIPVSAHDAAAVPLYRFFDTHTGTHFFTASDTERQSVLASRPDLVPEASSFLEHAAPQAGDVPVYRFFNSGDGTHFYTASATERASVSATRPDLTYEGVGFYAPAPT